MSNTSDQNSSESSIDKQRVEELCARFSADGNSESPTPVEDFLEEHLEGLSTDTQKSAFREILRTALETGRGNQVDAESLRKRFPGMSDIINSLVAGIGETMAFQGGTTSMNSKSGSLGLKSGHHSGSSSKELPEVLDRYKLEKELGRGGMGAVYLARDTKLDRLVALKIPTFGGEDENVLVERFYREARTMASINHVNLCTVHDVCEIDGFHCLVMEFVDGGSLCGKLEKERLIPLDEAVTLTAKLARALQLAHDAGVVHRDIKPANVLLRKDQEPVLTDFGLARMLFPQPDSLDSESSIANSGSRLTQSGALIGTPMYMSPEQVEADHDNMGPATDIYSLGVVMYLLISGRLPFEGSVARVLGKIVMQEPPPPSTHNSLIDQPLEAICLKAMAKKSEDRHASAAELASSLEEYLHKKSQPSISTSAAVEKVPDKRLTAAIAVAGISMLAVLGWAIFNNDSEIADSTAELPPNPQTQTVSKPTGDPTPESKTRIPEESTSLAIPSPESKEPNSPPVVNLARLPAATVVEAFNSSAGFVSERFAVCFEMSMPRFKANINELRSAGYEPKVVRPYSTADGAFVAAIWQPGDSNWDLQTGMTFEDFKAEDERQIAEGRGVSSLCANQGMLTAVWTGSAEPATWKYIASTNRPEEVYNDSDPLAADGLRPFTIHATARQGLLGVTQLWKPKSGNWELVRSRNTMSNESTYDPGDGLLDICLMPTGPTQFGGIFIWQDRPGVESKLVVANGFADQTDAMKRLDAEDWYPVSLTVAVRMRGNQPASGSVWHRQIRSTNSQ